MMHPVHVINPNSSERVTASIEAAVQAVSANFGIEFVYRTLHDGPAGITTQAQADHAATLVARHVNEYADQASGFILACFSDPGLFAAREITARPVLGIGHAGVLAALTQGQRVGVVAITDSSIPRHWRHWRVLGLERAVVNERALNLPVDQSGDADVALERMVEVGRELVQKDGADVLLLGCAGMASLRPLLQERLGMPVVDPCQATAFAMAHQLAMR